MKTDAMLLYAAEILRCNGCENFRQVMVRVTALDHPTQFVLQFRGDTSELASRETTNGNKIAALPQPLLSSQEITSNDVNPQSERPVRPSARHGREFSPTEVQIMQVVTGEWQTKVQLSEKCGYRLISSHFAVLLANLVERDYLESGNRGYRLKQ